MRYAWEVAKTADSQCPAFQAAIDILGKPWNALILTFLQAGPRRFSEIADAEHAPGDKVLSARLKELEARGLVRRHVAPGPPVRVTYELTEHGRGFGEVARAIQHWGHHLCTKSPLRARRRAAAVAKPRR